MTSILDKIKTQKKVEVELKKQLFPLPMLTDSPFFERDCLSLSKSLKNSSTGIIAEHKRRSPSKNNINQKLHCNEVVQAYERAGASSCSVLTDTSFFGGSLEDLQFARASVDLPILRKDFIIDEYQILEAKANGADAILLIAAILEPKTIKMFSRVAGELGLEVLLEVHNEKELEDNLNAEVQLIGVNNRDLKTFKVSLETSQKLADKIPGDIVKISESGLKTAEDILQLREFGYRGFLIGERFMKTDDPGKSASELIEKLSYKHA
jgi:indole-3-glycerol phosphate synthase